MTEEPSNENGGVAIDINRRSNAAPPQDDPSSAPPAPPAVSHPATITRKLSVSQSANETSGGWNAPWFLSFIEYPFHVKDPVDGSKLPEAAGWGMDSAARGPVNQIGGYVGSAIIRLASKDVGCQNPRVCDVAVKGGILKPSSLLTTTSAIVGVVGALLMPFVGAIVDHTRHRKLLGVVSGFVVVLVTGLQIMISQDPNNWLFMLILDAFGTFGLLVHTTSVFAYLPDLTRDEASLPAYTSAFTVRQYSAQVLFTSLLIVVNKVRNADRTLESSIQTARDASGMAFGVGALFIGYSWLFLFRKRPALSQVPEGQSLLSTGFLQVQTTAGRIWRDYKALKWFMIALLWSPEAGAGVVLSIVVSFLTVDIKISSSELAYISLLIMVGNILGGVWAKFVVKFVNPLNSYRCGLLILGTVIGIAAGVIIDESDRDVAIGSYHHSILSFFASVSRFLTFLFLTVASLNLRIGSCLGSCNGMDVLFTARSFLYAHSQGSRN